MAEFVTVCRVEDIPEGEARLFVVGERQIGVFRLQDVYFALQNECPHAGASLAHGIIEGDTVRCRIHHWQFRIRDGKYLDEEKPECAVPTFPTRVVDGNVQVKM